MGDLKDTDMNNEQALVGAKAVMLASAPWARAGDRVRITRVSTFLTAPAGAPLLVVRVETNQPGLVGYGCASSPQRPLAIRTVLDEYLGPLIVGRDVLDIDDLSHLLSLSPYWRGGAIENNALAGIDIALWDLKGKIAGLPVYQLLGGRARTSVAVYGHADGTDNSEVIDAVQRFMEDGYRYVRCQVAVKGADTYGTHSASGSSAAAELAKSRDSVWMSSPYLRSVPSMFKAVRDAVGWEVELLHDVHERVTVSQAIRLAESLDPFRLYFLEDAIAPEDLDWYRELRAHSTTPQAVGEVFSDIRTFIPLITNRLIDFARIRMGAIGGLTPTAKLAVLCELMGVRTAIHGPGDISPIGHAAALAVDVSSRAFGIQESVKYSDAVRDVFPGAPMIKDGAYEVSGGVGLGVSFDEREAQKYEVSSPLTYDSWALLRHKDGSVARP